jgi:predicted  nucleic acid-binding Zn-ribbon protein
VTTSNHASAPDAGGAATGSTSGGPFAALLDVQDHDTIVDQLRHRRATLPERAELAGIDRRLGALDGRAKEARLQRDDLAGRQSSLEQQIEASRARRQALEKRLYGGQVAAARELQAMSEEVKHLARHISELEDRELEVMEALEPVDGELQAADVERDALEEETTRVGAALKEAEGQIDAEITAQSAARAAAAGKVRGDLLNRYEQLRAKLGGTGAARLVGASCGGCHLALPAMEIDRIRKAPPDTVITCEQCGRILVR